MLSFLFIIHFHDINISTSRGIASEEGKKERVGTGSYEKGEFLLSHSSRSPTTAIEGQGKI